ncbi:MAG: hypothetical protein WAV66_10925, partial [Anaerolineae bacterium]
MPATNGFFATNFTNFHEGFLFFVSIREIRGRSLHHPRVLERFSAEVEQDCQAKTRSGQIV